ncbi:MAG: polysaccharide biosynthesis protein [Ignavibacteria bacterium]|jgi:FlaA1/EpsC-like NDP-sugar epimerase|nr:polysaccharide biosynthesis protein [Ignavibacteria bacterium]MBK9228681.1 polysaccharide biosynthesis protein [Ignavibacteria bacterium]
MLENFLNKGILKLRNRHLLVLDLLFLLISPFLALTLRLDVRVDLDTYITGLAYCTVIFLVIDMLVFLKLGLYKRYWHSASVDELAKLIYIVFWAVLIQSVVFIFLHNFGLFNFETLPLSIPLLDGIFIFFFVTGTRFSIRLMERLNEKRKISYHGERVLVAGSGKSGISIVQEMQRNPQLGMVPVAFIDDDIEKKDLKIRGIPVMGTRHSIPEAISRLAITKVIIAMPTAPGSEIRDIVSICRKCGVQTRTIPGIYEILDERVRIDSIREVQIEDLLRREPVQTDIKRVADFLKGKKVLVTGAGGSIGSELCRQIIKCSPSEITLLGQGENSIFDIHREILKRISLLNGKASSTNVKISVANVRSYNRVDNVLGEIQPDVIFHAAAHKHVPLMEMNSCEAISNNVKGTQNLIDLSLKHNVEHFVFISTDKAVNPSSIMGASKRVAEMIVLKAAREYGKNYSAVRFGNVLGSRGSVVLTFKKQITEGGPITITHPDIQRYFMTIPEAVQLVLQASVIGGGGEIFVLDMGKPIKIIDLAKDIIRLSGYEVEKDIRIVLTGLRPGEKLFEELFIPGEIYEKTIHEKILIAANASHFIPEGFEENLEILLEKRHENDRDTIVGLLKRLVPEYSGEEQPAILPQ